MPTKDKKEKLLITEERLKEILDELGVKVVKPEKKFYDFSISADVAVVGAYIKRTIVDKHGVIRMVVFGHNNREANHLISSVYNAIP